MNDAEEPLFERVQNFNFEKQDALGKELRDNSLLWAEGSEVPKNIPLAMRMLEIAYFEFRNKNSLEYLVDLLETEIYENRPTLHEVDLGKLAEELKALEKITESVRSKIDDVFRSSREAVASSEGPQ